MYVVRQNAKPIRNLHLPIYAPLPSSTSWPVIPRPRPPPLRILLLQFPSPNLLQQPSPELAVSNSPTRTPQCLAPSLQQAISRSSSSKPKAPPTRSPPSSTGKEAPPRTRITMLHLPGSSRNPVDRAYLDTAATRARGEGKEGGRGRGPRGA